MRHDGPFIKICVRQVDSLKIPMYARVFVVTGDLECVFQAYRRGDIRVFL